MKVYYITGNKKGSGINPAPQHFSFSQRYRTNALVASPPPARSDLVAAAATATAAAACAHLAVAVGAINGLVATRYERHLGVTSAIGANNLRHYALRATIAAATATTVAAVAIAITAVASGFLGGTAVGAAHRLAVALLRVKVLLTLGEGEGVAAIAARECLVCHLCSFPFRSGLP